MTITAEQREARRQYICSSDVGAILGCDPFRNAHDVYLEKVHGTYEATTKAMEHGNLMEGVLIEWAIKPLALGHGVDPQVYLGEEFTKHRFQSHLDARFVFPDQKLYPQAIVEAKFTTVTEGWGDEGTDEVPFHVMSQVQQQMFVTGITLAYVVACFPVYKGLDFRLYVIHYDEDMWTEIMARCTKFWNNHIRPDVPPTDLPSIRTLKNLVREDDEEPVAVPHRLVAYRQETADVLRKAQKADDEAKRALIAALGNKTHGITEEGHLVTYHEQRRKERIQPAATFRVLRTRKPKAPNTKG